ncbi:MAG: hypothetical protein PHR25_02425 [Clostridia bacterium]|nr:hypothetical protein [Clostridia bacterium]
MLYSEYLKKIESGATNIYEPSKKISKLHEIIHSNSRVERFISGMPIDWESRCNNIVEYDNVLIVKELFRNYVKVICGLPKEERKIINVVTHINHPAKPGIYIDAYKKDSDYNLTHDSELTVFEPCEFHVDHRLIWATQDMNAPNGDDLTVHIYVPSPQTIHFAAQLE